MEGLEEIQEAIETALANGFTELAVLHCVSGYPIPAKQYNLRVIQDLAERFNLVTGLSDHSIGNTVTVVAVVLGDAIIEKHFILSRQDGGHDSKFSCEPEELHELCETSRMAWEALGQVTYEVQTAEKSNLKFRRSLCAAQDIEKGEIFTNQNVKSVRPGFGLAPKHLREVLNRKSKAQIKKGTPIKWDFLEQLYS